MNRRSPSPRRFDRRYERSPPPYRGDSRRYSRSPVRRYSPSPARPYSRSARRYSRSPVRRYSRSPPRRYSRSPPRRYGRAPHPRRFGRSPPRFRNAPRRPVIRCTEEEKLVTTAIYVGNIPYEFNDSDITNMFERFGKLEHVSVPIDRFSRRNKGFAFVEFDTRSEAQAAFDHFNGSEIMGRPLRLDWDVGRNAKERSRPVEREDRSRSPLPTRKDDQMQDGDLADSLN